MGGRRKTFILRDSHLFSQKWSSEIERVDSSEDDTITVPCEFAHEAIDQVEFLRGKIVEYDSLLNVQQRIAGTHRTHLAIFRKALLRALQAQSLVEKQQYLEALATEYGMIWDGSWPRPGELE